MNGSLEERKGTKGTAWRMIAYWQNPESGKSEKITRTIPASENLNKTQAGRRLKEFVREIESPGFVKPNGETVNDILDAWLASVDSSGKVRPKTLENYRLILRKYVREFIGDRDVHRITPASIENLYLKLRQTRSKRSRTDDPQYLSARTVLHTHRTLSEAFKWSVRRGMLTTNPCELVDTPRFDRKSVRILEPGEVARVLDYMRQHSAWAVAPTVLALTTGARRSEILGLRWEDVLLRGPEPSISIQRAVTQLADQSRVIAPTKTQKSTRNVALTQQAVEALTEWREKRERQAEDIGTRVRRSDLIFSEPDEKQAGKITWEPLVPSSLSQAFRRACQAHGIDASFHDLRHTHASTLLRANVHPKIVQERLGHSTITTTLDIYSHVAPGLQQAAARVFSEAFQDAPEPDSHGVLNDAKPDALAPPN